MNWFLRLKFSNKLMLTFPICSAMTAATGLFGLTRLAELGACWRSEMRSERPAGRKLPFKPAAKPPARRSLRASLAPLPDETEFAQF